MGLGIICGIIGGLIPGIHSNTLAAIEAGWIVYLYPIIGTEGIAAVLVATLITHSFIEIVPSTFLGVPDEGTALSVLPAHAMTMIGKGQEAIRISALGTLLGIVLGLPVGVLAYLYLSKVQDLVDWWTGLLLVLILGYFIVKSEGTGYVLATFLVSGLLGLFAFRFEYLVWGAETGSTVLMPLLTGLFGIPLLLMTNNGKIPVQRYTRMNLSTRSISLGSIFGVLAGLLVGWLPGLSNATANGVIASFIGYDESKKQFLLATGAAGSANVVVGIFALYGIERMRNGVMVILGDLPRPPLLLLVLVLLLTAIVAYIVTLVISQSAVFFNGVNARVISYIVLIFLLLLCCISTGPFGLFILILATMTGLVPELLQISRVSCIGVVSIPVILYSFGIGGL